MRFLPQPKSMATKTEPISVRSCGVKLKRTSRTGAAAETIKETGEVTVFFSPSSSHVVFMERLSLPTGIANPISWQTTLAARTASKSLASSPFVPQAAIQLAESFTNPNSISALAMLVTASPIAIRLAAAASAMANGVLSPILIASPR